MNIKTKSNYLNRWKVEVNCDQHIIVKPEMQKPEILNLFNFGDVLIIF